MLLLQAAVAATSVTGSSWGDVAVSQGPMGVIAGFLFYALTRVWSEYKSALKQLDDEKAGRLADAIASSAKLLQMSDKVHSTTDDLAKIADRLERTKP